jgi:hypothetical protein
MSPESYRGVNRDHGQRLTTLDQTPWHRESTSLSMSKFNGVRGRSGSSMGKSAPASPPAGTLRRPYFMIPTAYGCGVENGHEVTIRVRQMDALFDLRGEEPIVAGLATACRLVLPSRPNSMTINGEDAVLGIGPTR